MADVALIDYRAGNLTSVKKALAAVGADVFVPDAPEAIAEARGIIVPGVGHFGADRRERLAHRRQIAGAIIDERNHNSPLVLGSIRARRLSFAHATRSALANALNTASILWWLDRP